MTEMAPWLLIALTVTEFLLLLVVLLFFKRLKRSEALLEQLQQKQQQFVAKLAFSAELEQELVSSFDERQKILADLEQRLSERSKELEDLLERSERARPASQGRATAQRYAPASKPTGERAVSRPQSSRANSAQNEVPARQIVLKGHERGLSPRTLAQASGLSLDEVELILLEAGRS